MPCRNGWGASAVDAFSTACVMQIPDIVNTILDFIPIIDFDQTSDQVSLFETTIRYIGGMLSGKDRSHVISFSTDSGRLRLFERPAV
jgi:mannosyl-oligosaccharide alpha-1,2-mannosidase